jgi:hypothetical protein
MLAFVRLLKKSRIRLQFDDFWLLSYKGAEISH